MLLRIRLFGVLAILLLSLVLGPACLAQAVRVRVINGQNDRPLQRLPISAQFFYTKLAKPSPPLHLETDSNGEGHFSVPEPTPERLEVRLISNPENWHCACWVMADTETVTRKGVVENAYGQAKPPIPLPEAEAGSVIFVLRPFTWWERVIAPFVRE